MNSPTTLFDFIPHNVEESILAYVDSSKKKSIDQYLHMLYFRKSLFYIDRKKLEKHIKGKLNNRYSATYKYTVGDTYSLALYHFPMFNDGSLMETNGRTNKLNFKLYIGGNNKVFLKTESIKYHRVYNNFTKKQRQKLWLFSKILLTDKVWEK